MVRGLVDARFRGHGPNGIERQNRPIRAASRRHKLDRNPIRIGNSHRSRCRSVRHGDSTLTQDAPDRFGRILDADADVVDPRPAPEVEPAEINSTTESPTENALKRLEAADAISVPNSRL